MNRDQPDGRKGTATPLKNALIAVVRVAGEGVVVGMEAHVDTRAEQMTERRTRKESAEPGELGIARLDRDDAALIVALVAREEERPVLRIGPPTAPPNWCRRKNGSGLTGHGARPG